MKKLTKLIIVAVTSALLGACSSLDVTRTRTVLITPPDYLLTPCEVPKPPKKSDYMKAKKNEKDKMMVDIIANQYSAARKCNTKLSAIRDWKKEQLKIYEGKIK